MLVDNRLSVAEFRGNVHLDRDAQQLLKRVLCDDADVVRRAAGDDTDLREALKLLRRQRDVVEHDAPAADARRDRIPHGLRLLADLLHHKVLVTALFRRLDIPLDVLRRLFDRLGVRVEERHCVAREHRDLVVL